MTEAIEQDRLMTGKEVAAVVGFTLRHIANLEQAGSFPRRVQIGVRAVRWSAAEVARWVEARKAARSETTSAQ